jgi:hypothetical protein
MHKCKLLSDVYTGRNLCSEVESVAHYCHVPVTAAAIHSRQLLCSKIYHMAPVPWGLCELPILHLSVWDPTFCVISATATSVPFKLYFVLRHGTQLHIQQDLCWPPLLITGSQQHRLSLGTFPTVWAWTSPSVGSWHWAPQLEAVYTVFSFLYCLWYFHKSKIISKLKLIFRKRPWF